MLVIKTLSPVSNFQNLQLLYLAKIISYKNFSEANFFKISRFEVMTSRFAVNTLTHCATVIDCVAVIGKETIH